MSSVAVEAGGGGQEEASWRTRLVEEVGGAFKVAAVDEFEGDDFAALAMPCSSLLDPLTPPSSKAGIVVVESSASPAEEAGANKRARRGVDVPFGN